MTRPAIVLPPEQEAQAQRLAAQMHQASKDDFLHLARLLVSKPDAQLFGPTEFELREQAHRLATDALQVALEQRTKKTTT
jgi:hypothetical protein